jgi:hypothetical protein
MKPINILTGAVFVTAFASTDANAVAFPPISDLSPYAIVSVGPAASLTINSGPIVGKVLAGDGSSVSTSGGGNGGITAGAYADTSALLAAFNHLQTPPTETLVSTAVTSSAFAQAQGLQTFLDGLTATQTFGALTSSTSITASGGLNVISFTSLHNAPLTLTGAAGDYFVLRTSGKVQTNRTMTLTGGLTPDHVIWDLGGASGNVLQTSGGDQLYGTFIDTKGGRFQFSSLNLTGQLINTGGHIQFVSNSSMTGSPLAVPEASTWITMLVGFCGLGAMLRGRRRAAQA